MSQSKNLFLIPHYYYKPTNPRITEDRRGLVGIVGTANNITRAFII